MLLFLLFCCFVVLFFLFFIVNLFVSADADSLAAVFVTVVFVSLIF